MKPIPVEQFIEESEYIHGIGKFDYSLVHENYKNSQSLVKIKCNTCGKISDKYETNIEILLEQFITSLKQKTLPINLRRVFYLK